jgi:hypothetical protein
MELPAAKTVPPLLLLTALDGASDLGCLPLSLFSKRPGLAGGQSEALRERFSLARLKIRRAKNLREESSRTKNDPRGGNFGLDPLLKQIRMKKMTDEEIVTCLGQLSGQQRQ